MCACMEKTYTYNIYVPARGRTTNMTIMSTVLVLIVLTAIRNMIAVVTMAIMVIMTVMVIVEERSYLQY